MKSQLYVGCAVIVLATGVPCSAGETITHKFDAKGRLIEVKRVGTSGAHVTTAYRYDQADNRVDVTTTGSPNGGPPPAPPPPPPANRPPVANPDNGGTMGKCAVKTVNVTANDADPDGDPLTVLGATGSGGVWASVVSASSVQIDSSQTAGAKSISYTISDGRGGTASSTISVTVLNGICN